MDTVSATAAGFSSRRSQLRFASSKVALSLAESSSASNSTTGVVPWRTSGSMSTVFLLYERSGAPRRAAGATASAAKRSGRELAVLLKATSSAASKAHSACESQE